MRASDASDCCSPSALPSFTCEFDEIHPEFRHLSPRRREAELQARDAAPSFKEVALFKLLGSGGSRGVVAADHADGAVFDSLFKERDADMVGSSEWWIRLRMTSE